LPALATSLSPWFLKFPASVLHTFSSLGLGPDAAASELETEKSSATLEQEAAGEPPLEVVPEPPKDSLSPEDLQILKSIEEEALLILAELDMELDRHLSTEI
jgi:hypothetical protein